MPSLLDVFQILVVPVFDAATCRSVLDRVATAQAKAAKLEFPPGGCSLVQQLFTRFQPYSTLPGPAVDFIRSLIHDATSKRPSDSGSQPSRDLSLGQILKAFARRTGLPEMLLRDEEPLDLARVRQFFEEQIVGQPAAIQTAVRVVASIKAGLTDPARPTAVLLFCGPTGVGKTALAHTLASFCFGASGQKDRLVRLDLSEFSGPLAARRLVQGPSGEPADWLQKVRAQPFCVVLFDEIEKAAPEVFDVLLGVLDEGRLTDAFGRVTQFRSAVILLTSNLGSSNATRMGFGADGGPDYDAEVQRFFRPEFFNRLDAVVSFNALTPENVQRIVRKEFVEIRAREGIASMNLELEWDAALESAVAKAGYDHRLGTRPLQRALERMVVVPLARWLLENTPVPGTQLRLSLNPTGGLAVAAVPPTGRV
jgi:ATP-dependent Clp protease ATP-binding subunit ClpC